MKIAVIGGDKRMLFAARAFMIGGHEVYLAGFDDLTSLCEIRVCDIKEAVRHSDIVVLPVRPSADGYLNAQYQKRITSLSDLGAVIGEKPVFTGCAEQVLPYLNGNVFDYSVQEDFTRRNAALTAEGTVGLLVREYEGSVCGTAILITGYGRIGKCLSAYLKAMGANVTVAARKISDRAAARSCGIEAVDYPGMDCSAFPVIINTVPAPVLDRNAVDRMREDVFIVDLASKPGGVDFIRAEERGLTCIHALSLPGKTAPLAAGTIIKDTIMNMIDRGCRPEPLG